MRRILIVVVLASCLLGGCGRSPVAPPSQASPPVVSGESSSGDDVSVTMRNILGQMGAAVAPEPSRDVTSGLFLGHITRIEAASPEAITVDFVTAQMEPGLTDQQRRSSSWPDRFGWNRYAHRQRLSAANASALIKGGLRFEPATFDEFAADWSSDPDASSLKYYLLVRDGGLIAAWPWQY